MYSFIREALSYTGLWASSLTSSAKQTKQNGQNWDGGAEGGT